MTGKIDILGGNFELDRISKGSSLQLGYFGGHRCREQVRIPVLARHGAQDLVNDWTKVEVEQPISFVHDLRRHVSSRTLCCSELSLCPSDV